MPQDKVEDTGRAKRKEKSVLTERRFLDLCIVLRHLQDGMMTAEAQLAMTVYLDAYAVRHAISVLSGLIREQELFDANKNSSLPYLGEPPF